MFENLTNNLQSIFSKFSKNKSISEDNIQEVMREIRIALLDADVNFSVVSELIRNIKEKALGQEVLRSVKASEQFVKIVHDELIAIMGNEEAPLKLNKQPTILMMCGLQGAGKTTHCAKLAKFIQKKDPNKRVLLAACDRQRPAAIEQLKTLANSIDVPVVWDHASNDPRKIAKEALKKAQKEGFDVLIVDSAGRLHIDEEMMQELVEIKNIIEPHEVLYVASATSGQEAAKVAVSFNEHIEITGSILTMLDSDARAGAALSITYLTKKPLKFEGVGEKIDDLQLFNPNSMADRILGYGDTINLVRKAEELIDDEDSKEMEEKLRKATFTYNDYLKQMGAIKKMGSIKSLLKMLPGASQLQNLDIPEDMFKKSEAIIQSMTQKERLGLDEIIMPRRKRIAKGSGTSLDDVNRMIKSFKQAKDFVRKMPKNSKMKNLIGEKLWQ